MLTLPEEFFLLTLDDDGRSRFTGTSATACGVTAAILLELEVQGGITLANDAVRVERAGPTGYVFLDTAMTLIRPYEGRNLKSCADVIRSIFSMLREGIVASLTARGIIEVREERVLHLFRRLRYPCVNVEPKRELLSRLGAAIPCNNLPDARTTTLIALLDATSHVRCFLDRDHQRQAFIASSAISGIAPLGVALTTEWVRDALDEEAEAAAAVAVIAATS